MHTMRDSGHDRMATHVHAPWSQLHTQMHLPHGAADDMHREHTTCGTQHGMASSAHGNNPPRLK